MPTLALIVLPIILSSSATWEHGGATPMIGGVDVCHDLHALHVAWWRTWMWDNAPTCPSIEYVPAIVDTQWLTPTPHLSPSKWLLTFNEPNLTQQANMTPEEAAAHWPLIERVAGARNIMSPAVYAGYGWDGGDWLERFLALCAECRIDGIDLHWYSFTICDERAARAFETYLQRRRAQFPDKPIWLSEYGCRDDARTFAQLAVPIAERYTERNALWAVYMPPELPEWEPLVRYGALTPLGAIYAGEP